jgi:hypothetical protein
MEYPMGKRKEIDNAAMAKKLKTEIADLERYIDQHKKTIKLKTAEKEVYDLRVEVAELRAKAK